MISKLAIIDPASKIADNVTLGPYSIIGPDVEIGEGTWIGPHVVINGLVKIGRDNKIFQFASFDEPQDKKYKGEPTRIEIGDRNVFRESCTVSRGTVQGEGLTKIGSDNLFMAYVHIAHDCIVGNHTVFSNNASLAGHVVVHDHVTLGGFVGVHQFCSIGEYSFCAGGSIVLKDVPPFMMVSGFPAQAFGLNSVGLKRHGFTDEMLNTIKRAYKMLYRQNLKLEEALEKIEKELVPECAQLSRLIEFVKLTERGIIRSC